MMLLLISGKIYSQDESLLTAMNRKRFGNYLFQQQDYYRANNEFRQYLRYENNDTVRFKIAFGLAEIGELEQSQDYLKSLFVNSRFSEEAKILFFKIKYLENNFEDFSLLKENKIYFTSLYQSNVNKLWSCFNLQVSKTISDSSDLFAAFRKRELDTVRSFYLRKYYPDNKSETIAGILSAIFPGAGKIYTENISDGITSLLFTSALGILSYNNFRNNHKVRGWIFGALAGYFYAGNIYGSVASARIYNADIQFKVQFDISEFLKNKNYFMPEIRGISK
jgi:TM2 domain-containing membrane protein YozV